MNDLRRSVRLISLLCALSLFAVQPGFAATKSVTKLKSAGRTANSIPNTILNGLTPPTKSIGINGDFYIDIKNLNIYGPKKNNSWPVAISLRGTAGTDGKTGTPGVAGADGKTITNTSTVGGGAGTPGATGATGATGANGSNGAAGVAGANGAAGETGAAGASGSAGPAGPPGPAGSTGETGAAGAPGAAGTTGIKVYEFTPWAISTSTAGSGSIFTVFPLLEANKKYIFTVMIKAMRERFPGEITGSIAMGSGSAGLISSSIITLPTSNLLGTILTSEIMFQGTIQVGAAVDGLRLTVVDITGHSVDDSIALTGVAWLTEIGSIT